MCPAEPVDYQLSVTLDDYVRDFYVDGRQYDVPMADVWHVKGTLSLDYMPSVIAVSGNDIGGTFGFLASDNAGRITDDRYCRSSIVQLTVDAVVVVIVFIIITMIVISHRGVARLTDHTEH